MTPASPSFETFLVRAGLADVENIKGLDNISFSIGIPVGKLLVHENIISKLELRNVSILYAYVMDGMLSLDDAIQSVSLIQLDIGTFLGQIKAKFPGADIDESLVLGRMLLSADILSPQTVEHVLQTALEESVFLGHVILRSKLLPPTVIAMALQLQQEKRSQEINRETAINRLREFSKIKSGS